MGSAADRMKKMRDRLQERTKESYERKDDYGISSNYFKKEGNVLTADGREVPVGEVLIWKPKIDVHVFDIVPTFAGDRWPLDSHGIKLPTGEAVYVLEIAVHMAVGMNDLQFVCLNRNYGEPCPICEHQAELKKEVDYDEKLIKSLYPKRRNVYNVVCYDSEEEENKGIQVFECAQFFMEAKLTPLAFDALTKELISYPDYTKTGKMIQFKIKKKTYKDVETGQASSGTDYVGHKFLDRDYDLSDEELDGAFVLDSVIHIPTYEEVYKPYWAGIKDLPNGETQEQTPVGGSRRRSQRPAREEKAEVKDEVTAGKCPADGKFGEDIDQLGDSCNTCQVYDDCAHRAEELKARGSEDRQPSGGGRRSGRRSGGTSKTEESPSRLKRRPRA